MATKEFVKGVMEMAKKDGRGLDWMIIPPQPKEDKSKEDNEDYDDEPEPFAVAFDLDAEWDACGDGYFVYPKLIVWNGYFTKEHDLREGTEVVVEDSTFVYTPECDGSRYGGTTYRLTQKRNDFDVDIYHYQSSSYDMMPSAYPQTFHLKEVDEGEDIYVSDVGLY